MSKPSKFATIIEQARGRGPEPDDTTPGETTTTPAVPIPEPPAVELPAPPPAEGTPPALLSVPASKGPGRPRGKRSDPDFEQVTAYLPSAIYTRVRIALMEDGRRQDFSALVAGLLAGWLDDRPRE